MINLYLKGQFPISMNCTSACLYVFWFSHIISLNVVDLCETTVASVIGTLTSNRISQEFPNHNWFENKWFKNKDGSSQKTSPTRVTKTNSSSKTRVPTSPHDNQSAENRQKSPKGKYGR